MLHHDFMFYSDFSMAKKANKNMRYDKPKQNVKREGERTQKSNRHQANQWFVSLALLHRHFKRIRLRLRKLALKRCKEPIERKRKKNYNKLPKLSRIEQNAQNRNKRTV